MKDQMTPRADTARIAAGFRRSLDTYGTAANVQAEIAQELAGQIAAHGPPEIAQVFEFGCGTGVLTRALRTQLNDVQFILNDLVAECAATAAPGEVFLPGSVDDIALPQGVGLIASASTVQWLPDLPGTLRRLSDALVPGGLLALSGFGTAQFAQLGALGSAGAAPGYLNATQWRQVLPGDLQVLHLSQRQTTLHFPDALSVLRHLRDTGVNGVSGQRWSRRRLTAFAAAYQARFGTAEGLPLTYDPVWIVARKAY